MFDVDGYVKIGIELARSIYKGNKSDRRSPLEEVVKPMFSDLGPVVNDVLRTLEELEQQLLSGDAQEISSGLRDFHRKRRATMRVRHDIDHLALAYGSSKKLMQYRGFFELVGEVLAMGADGTKMKVVAGLLDSYEGGRRPLDNEELSIAIKFIRESTEKRWHDLVNVYARMVADARR